MTDVVYSYSRKQAIADGVLVDVSHMAKGCGFRIPVAVTRAVWERCVAVPPNVVVHDEPGRLWDLLWMLGHSMVSGSNPTSVSYSMSVQNDHYPPQWVSLRGECDPGDEGGICHHDLDAG